MRHKILTFSIAIIIGIVVSLGNAKTPNQNYHWCKTHYGELTAAEQPLVTRAKAVFDRVAAVADKRAQRPPRLLITPIASEPWAASLGDGTILLNRHGLERCYQNVDKPTGDSRLAFVIGHELAHLVNDDFWHLESLNVIRQFGSGSRAEKEVADLIRKAGGYVNTAGASQSIKEKELHADKYGLLYAAMAGYDPQSIVSSRSNHFFSAWTGQTLQTVAYKDINHPTPIQRADFLLTEMEKVKNQIVLFDMGVHLFQIGRYAYAACFFESFRDHFPSREVYNNIGLAYFQMAMQYLAKCDPDKALRFKLATILEIETRASEYVRTGPTAKHRFLKYFKTDMRKAIGNFIQAKDRDPYYSSAYINLSSASIAMGEYFQAEAVFEEMKKYLPRSENDHRVKNNRAIARYLREYSRNHNASDQLINDLRNIAKNHPDFADVYYNLGRIWEEKGKKRDAQTFWHKFIELEPNNLFAAAANRALKNPIKAKMAPRSRCYQSKAITIGNYGANVLALLGGEAAEGLSGKYRVKRLDISAMDAKLFSKGSNNILVIEDKIEMMASPSKPNVHADGIKSQYGRPIRIFKHVSGRNTWVYANFAVDIVKDKICRIVYFKRTE